MLQQGPKDKDSISWRPPAGPESRGSGSLTSISALIHYRLYLTERLSVDFVEMPHDTFVGLLSP